MDYVVFGIGFGATLLVLGLMIRDLGPRVRYRTPSGRDGVFPAEQLVARVAWVRFCGALGAVLAVAGVLFVLVTLTCMVWTIHDDTAPLVMGIALAIVLLATAFWTWAFFDRFGSYGILPEREVAPPAEPKGRPVDADRKPDQAIEHGTGPDEPHVEPAGTAPMIGPPLPEPRVPTPEERLAAASDAIEHGSAEVDLDTPSVANRMHVRMGHATRLSERSEESPSSGEPATQQPVPTDAEPQPSEAEERVEEGDTDETGTPPGDGLKSG